MTKNIIWGEQQPVSPTFGYIKPFYVDRVTKHTCDTIKGTREVHIVRFVGVMDVNKLLKKDLGLFLLLLFGFYILALWKSTKEWEVEVLIPNSVGYVRHTMEDIF